MPFFLNFYSMCFISLERLLIETIDTIPFLSSSISIWPLIIVYKLLLHRRNLITVQILKLISHLLQIKLMREPLIVLINEDLVLDKDMLHDPRDKGETS
jgi:hypothetical protein